MPIPCPALHQAYRSGDGVHLYRVIEVALRPAGVRLAPAYRVRVATVRDLELGLDVPWIDDAVFELLVADEGLQPVVA